MRVPYSLLQGHANFLGLGLLILEVYQNNRKWLFQRIYKPGNQNDIEFLNRTRAILDYNFQKYDNGTTIGDFSISTENTHLQSMMKAFNLKDLIKEPICFQSNNPSQIDLILTNQKRMYKFSNTVETVLSTITNSYQLFQNREHQRKTPDKRILFLLIFYKSPL